ncbi:hypothetical protein Salat_0854900 [Sesamum alatum]|uniref:Uncharacterized protein n=1 Tax=Sesamum alatum TaxID=300844 RepID=A0AAE1YIP8_9LAMI|nr:hypothetical protein Salat_0854900 [Sesamum alatum]
MFVGIQNKVWNSIQGWNSNSFDVRHLIIAGSCSRVGNVEHIRIWGDRWLPREPDLKLIRMSQHSNFELKVKSLIDPTHNEWKSDLIHGLLHPLDAKNCSLYYSRLPLYQGPAHLPS